MPKERYLVEHGLPKAIDGCNTVEDLARYLRGDPHPDYRLVSCQSGGGNFTLVWERKDERSTEIGPA